MMWNVAYMKDLAAYLQREKEARGWTQRHFEDVTGISKTGLQSMLSGGTKVPKLDSLQRLAKAFDVSLSYLIELCGFDLEEELKLTEEERTLLRQLPAEQRLRAIRRAWEEVNGRTPP